MNIKNMTPDSRYEIITYYKLYAKEWLYKLNQIKYIKINNYG